MLDISIVKVRKEHTISMGQSILLSEERSILRLFSKVETRVEV